MWASLNRKSSITCRPTPTPAASKSGPPVEQLFEEWQGQAEATRKLLDENKKGAGAVNEFAKLEGKLWKELNQERYISNDSSLKKLVTELEDSSECLGVQTKEFVDVNDSAIVQPLKQFQKIYTAVDSSFQFRENILNDYNKYREKIQRFSNSERTGSVIAKLADLNQEAEKCGEKLRKSDAKLQEELPALYGQRFQYLQPSFQAKVLAEINYYGERMSDYKDLASKNSNQSMLCGAGKPQLATYDQKMKEHFELLSQIPCIYSEDTSPQQG